MHSLILLISRLYIFEFIFSEHMKRVNLGFSVVTSYFLSSYIRASLQKRQYGYIKREIEIISSLRFTRIQELRFA